MNQEVWQNLAKFLLTLSKKINDKSVACISKNGGLLDICNNNNIDFMSYLIPSDKLAIIPLPFNGNHVDLQTQVRKQII